MREFDTAEEFGRYLESLDGSKPFECPNLKVLPVDVYSREGNKVYGKGNLICAAIAGKLNTNYVFNDYDHRCRVDSSLKQEEDGSFVIKCKWNSTKLKFTGVSKTAEITKKI